MNLPPAKQLELLTEITAGLLASNVDRFFSADHSPYSTLHNAQEVKDRGLAWKEGLLGTEVAYKILNDLVSEINARNPTGAPL